MSVAPHEIFLSRFDVYLAPVGEVYPVIDAAPAGNWVKLGTNGVRNFGEEGVTISPAQVMDPIHVYGATGPVKYARTQETLLLSFMLYDFTLEEYTRLLNNVTVVQNAAASGIAGFKEIDNKFGLDPYEVALLLRAGQSPYGTGWNTQLEVPKVVQSGSPTMVSVKNDAMKIAFEFSAVEDPAAASDDKRFGRWLQQDATAL